MPEEPYTEYQEQRTGRGKGWRVIFIIALIVFLIAAGALGYLLYTYLHGQQVYDELDDYMTISDSSSIVTLGSFDVDWEALKAINSDIVGWVYVPGTNINYPIVWRYNDDNYYMKHNFRGETQGYYGAEYGCPLLSGINNPFWTDQLSVVAGHNMWNGTMFTSLFDFQDSAVFNEHRTFYVFTPQGNFKTTSFACDKVPGSSKEVIIPNFESREEFDAYLWNVIHSSLATPNPPGPEIKDIQQVIAFYTCSEPDNKYRIIVYCNVDEFLPAGSDVAESNSLANAADVNAVESSVGERL